MVGSGGLCGKFCRDLYISNPDNNTSSMQSSDDEDYSDGPIHEMPLRKSSRIPEEYKEKYSRIKTAMRGRIGIYWQKGQPNDVIIGFHTPGDSPQVSIKINDPGCYGVAYVNYGIYGINTTTACSTFHELIETIETESIPWLQHLSPNGPACDQE